MRFVNNGPSIPDELLVAADKGDVVFFCGAGVSQQSAKLPDFFGLATDVANDLTLPGHRVRALLDALQNGEAKQLFDGLVSADRLFGILESEFPLNEVEGAVAKALRPKDEVDLSAHQILLRLAKGSHGKLRLVTTNFDRLFDDCGLSNKTFIAPELPDPAQPDEFDGVVYLHGCFYADYSDSEGRGLVLTSSQFGDAYLAEGWATKFFKQIVAKYVVVFIGYSADDPPIRYLLEALNNKPEQLRNVYAFEDGAVEQVASKWRDRGVKGIAYPAGDHDVLWETLKAWSLRVEDKGQWYKQVLEMGIQGPEKLDPHQRGQVAHMASHLDGARALARGAEVIPAEWLCVFDKSIRYSEPRKVGGIGSEGPTVDPFECYGLDDDIFPESLGADEYHKQRRTPEDAWHAFEISELDWGGLEKHHVTSFYDGPTNLPERIRQLIFWIKRVSHQPATLWWLAQQRRLHPELIEGVERQLYYGNQEFDPVVRDAWLMLLDTVGDMGYDVNTWFELNRIIKKDGWSRRVADKYVEHFTPRLKIKDSLWASPVPPSLFDSLRQQDMFYLEVDYSGAENSRNEDVHVPEEWLLPVVVGLRRNIEKALVLEENYNESQFQWLHICSIIPDDDPAAHGFERGRDLSCLVLTYVPLFEQLLEHDVEKAKVEFTHWPEAESIVFDRLRIWVGGNPLLASSEMLSKTITGLSDDVFWGSHHQRDLLLVLAKRWGDLTEDAQLRCEERLIKGHHEWDEEIRTPRSLSRIQWLSDQRCNFSFDVSAALQGLREKAPDWKPEYASTVVQSGMRGGFVAEDLEHTFLLTEPISQIIAKVLEHTGRKDDILVEKDPFGGLVYSKPVRAFRALSCCAQTGDFPEWAWSKFLFSEGRSNDSLRFIELVAKRMASYEATGIETFIYPAASWLRNVSKKLAEWNPDLFSLVFRKFIEVLRLNPKSGATNIVQRGGRHDWNSEAFNSSAGRLVEALFNHPSFLNSKVGLAFDPKWASLVSELLQLKDDLHRYALNRLNRNLSWMHAVDPVWTMSTLCPILKGDDADDREAFLAGFLYGREMPGPDLWKALDPHLLELVKGTSSLKEQMIGTLAGLFLLGWDDVDKNKSRLVSNDEFRDVLLNGGDIFRSSVLWQIERWYNDSKNPDLYWAEKLVVLFNDVWPRQKVAKTPAISVRLCDVAFSMKEHFKIVASAALPLIVAGDVAHISLPELRKSGGDLVSSFPEETLALLYAILPANSRSWPYRIEEVFSEIEEADAGDFSCDKRLIELRAKLHAQ